MRYASMRAMIGVAGARELPSPRLRWRSLSGPRVAVATVPGVSATVSEERSVARRPPPAAPPVAVSAHHLSKTFRLPQERYHTLKERALHPLRARRAHVLHALHDVSVEIASGEFFGIVGRNGSGKSTLLKCLAGIYRIDRGELHVEGRLSPFIELGVGFNPDLTARDNVIINAIMLGLSRRQARARFDDILAFAELQEFVDLKLKNYSSGMYVRLAFATAVQVDADILLIDEVLAVGDAAFQQKCFDEFARLKREGRTVILVTHAMSVVEHFCDRAMLLDEGRVLALGEPREITERYHAVNFRHMRSEAISRGGPELLKAGAAEILGAQITDAAGQPVLEAQADEEHVLLLTVRFHQEALDPIFAIALIDDEERLAFAASTQLSALRTGRFAAGCTARVALRFTNWLAPGRYRVLASVTRDGLGVDAYDMRAELTTVYVRSGRAGGGKVDLPTSWTVSRS